MDTIFVSSTFQDMQYERDAIQKDVFPRLNAIAHEYGQSVSFCDLRWGINTENLDSEEMNYKVLDVCLDEVGRSDNPMVIILGDRYGWIPPKELIKRMASDKDMKLDDFDISATALEIEYGRFTLNKNALIYFRTIQGNPADACFSSEDEMHHQKMEQLKEKIRNTTEESLKTYSLNFDEDLSKEIAKFSDMLYQDLLEKLLPKWKAYADQTPLMREAGIHWQFINEKKSLFHARKEQVDEIIGQITGGNRLIAIKGESGTGKSTVFSKIAYELKERGFNVIPIVSGLTSKVTTAYDVIKYEVMTIESLFPDYITAYAVDEDNSIDRWIRRLNIACQLYSQYCEMPLIIMVDAVDQLLPDDDRDELVFIPSNMPPNISFLFTSLLEIKKYSDKVYYLENMKNMDREDVVRGILSRHRKELSKQVTDAVVLKNGNPLYIEFLMQRLLLMNRQDFTIIRQDGGDIKAITSRQIEIVQNSPNSLDEMCIKAFEEAAGLFGGDLVKKVSQFLSLSRYGLRDTDLSALIGEKWNYLDFAHLICLLSDNFLKREDGRYDYMHKCIRNGILSTIENKKRLHCEIFPMLKNLAGEDPVRRSELIYHGVLADEIQTTSQLIIESIPTKDEKVLKPMAENLYYLCRHGGTESVRNLIKEINKDKIEPWFLWFFEVYCMPLFNLNVCDSKEFVELAQTIRKLLELNHILDVKDSYFINLVIRMYMHIIRSCILLHDMKSAIGFTNDYYLFIETANKCGLFENEGYAALLSSFFYFAKGLSDEPEWLDRLTEIADKKIEENILEFISDEMKGPFLGCIGEIYYRKKDYEKVAELYLKDLEYRKKAAEENLSDENMFYLSGAYGNVGHIYMKNQNYEKAREYYEKSLSLLVDNKFYQSLDIIDKQEYRNVKFNLVNCYLALGINSKELFVKAYEYIWDEINDGRLYYKETQDLEAINNSSFVILGEVMKDIYYRDSIKGMDYNCIFQDFKERVEKILAEDAKAFVSEIYNDNHDNNFAMIRKEFAGFYTTIDRFSNDVFVNWLNKLMYRDLIKPMKAKLEEVREKDLGARVVIYHYIIVLLGEWGEYFKTESVLKDAIKYAEFFEKGLPLSSLEDRDILMVF